MQTTVEKPKVIKGTGSYYKRKIKCPRHYLIHPSVDIYKYEPVPELKNVSKSLITSGRARNKRVVKDMFGNKVVDWRKVYALEKQKSGKVIQPEISASFAIEQVFDPKHPICKLCQGRCKEGKGTINENSIQRLTG